MIFLQALIATLGLIGIIVTVYLCCGGIVYVTSRVDDWRVSLLAFSGFTLAGFYVSMLIYLATMAR